ncbi:unnamed protein product [Mytilus edulis]|uniref:Uncharacterized protein n=1 Tax=Mytilus edulis TaxID=6550 RepID=A0A8S3PNK0_MYTED|nr:unnamed protein product [Mytilus edulis]
MQVRKFYCGSKSVTRCTILHDRRMAFTAYDYKQLVIRKADGSPDFRIPLKESNAFDITIVKDATVAVSCGSCSGDRACIQIIDLNSREITKILNTTNRVYGIVYFDQSFVFCGYDTSGIYAFNVETEQQSKISCTIGVGLWSYVTYFNNKFYMTNERNHTVNHFDNKGSVIWAYEDDFNMMEPRGISVDNNGNVFVASAGSNNVTIISPDGSRAKEILDQNNGLNEPCALHYDRSTNQLLVANFKGMAFLFNAK